MPKRKLGRIVQGRTITITQLNKIEPGMFIPGMTTVYTQGRLLSKEKMARLLLFLILLVLSSLSEEKGKY